MKLKRLTSKIVPSWPVAFFLYLLIRLYSLTLRLRVENEDRWREHLAAGGRVVLCAWHQQFFAAIRHFKSYAHLGPSLMISRSGDGELIAKVARLTGWQTVRGSSSRGGKAALERLIERVEETGFGAHVVDGPRGPAGRVKAGLIRLANDTSAALAPFYVTADRCWHANSWDRFLIPKPFARVTLRFGELIRLDPTDDPDEFERQRRAVEAEMRRAGWTDDPIH